MPGAGREVPGDPRPHGEAGQLWVQERLRRRRHRQGAGSRRRRRRRRGRRDVPTCAGETVLLISESRSALFSFSKRDCCYMYLDRIFTHMHLRKVRFILVGKMNASSTTLFFFLLCAFFTALPRAPPCTSSRGCCCGPSAAAAVPLPEKTTPAGSWSAGAGGSPWTSGS